MSTADKPSIGMWATTRAAFSVLGLWSFADAWLAMSNKPVSSAIAALLAAIVLESLFIIHLREFEARWDNELRLNLFQASFTGRGRRTRLAPSYRCQKKI